MIKPELNILSFHGLYSKGHELEILVNALEFEAEERGINVVTSQHDYPVLKLRQGWKQWAREMVAEYILKCLALEYRKFPQALCYVICHSNGTYGIANALEKYWYEKPAMYDKIKIDKLFLFGSVIPSDYDWDRFRETEVVNFIGSRDFVSGIAPLYGMGNSGKYGFNINSINLTEIYTDWKHSDFVADTNFDLIKDQFFNTL